MAIEPNANPTSVLFGDCESHSRKSYDRSEITWCRFTIMYHPTATGFDSRRGRSRIFACGNCAGRCRWSAGFLGDLPFPLSLNSGTIQQPHRFTRIGSQDRAAEISPLRHIHTSAVLNCSRERHALRPFSVMFHTQTYRCDVIRLRWWWKPPCKPLVSSGLVCSRPLYGSYDRRNSVVSLCSMPRRDKRGERLSQLFKEATRRRDAHLVPLETRKAPAAPLFTTAVPERPCRCSSSGLVCRACRRFAKTLHSSRTPILYKGLANKKTTMSRVYRGLPNLACFHLDPRNTRGSSYDPRSAGAIGPHWHVLQESHRRYSHGSELACSVLVVLRLYVNIAHTLEQAEPITKLQERRTNPNLSGQGLNLLLAGVAANKLTPEAKNVEECEVQPTIEFLWPEKISIAKENKDKYKFRKLVVSRRPALESVTPEYRTEWGLARTCTPLHMVARRRRCHSAKRPASHRRSHDLDSMADERHTYREVPQVRVPMNADELLWSPIFLLWVIAAKFAWELPARSAGSFTFAFFWTYFLHIRGSLLGASVFTARIVISRGKLRHVIVSATDRIKSTTSFEISTCVYIGGRLVCRVVHVFPSRCSVFLEAEDFLALPVANQEHVQLEAHDVVTRAGTPSRQPRWFTRLQTFYILAALPKVAHDDDLVLPQLRQYSLITLSHNSSAGHCGVTDIIHTFSQLSENWIVLLSRLTAAAGQKFSQNETPRLTGFR
ncbi:hypothetical protein PR048_014233 [Dryococelus australis]|uniref:Uncharacterized protein n=1 Tax=Dryococelus australis TaxID=614101 RepID=A0ABQ9HDS6_9NEOP|nr:hypothetical protein PR048_014233 [Dryococelus australis]